MISKTNTLIEPSHNNLAKMLKMRVEDLFEDSISFQFV